MSRRVRLLQASILSVLIALAGFSTISASTPAGWTYIDLDGTRHEFANALYDACDNVVDGGTIGNDVSGCANPTFQAPTIQSLTLPQGGSGDLEFLWMTTTVDPNSGAPVSWSVIPNSTTASYTPLPLTETAYFMRCARRSGCTEYAGESNFVTVLIDCCDNATAGGSISGDQTSCGVPFDPALIRNTGAASGGSNAMQYAWYSSTTTNTFTPGSPDWTLISGVSTPYYDPPALNQVTYFVRTAQREFCGEIGAFSNVVTISAHPNPTLKADTVNVTCFGDTDGSATITIINAAAPFTYQWLDNGSTSLVRTGMAPGEYQFEIVDGNGCSSIETVTIGEPAQVQVAIDAQFDQCNFVDADLTAIVSNEVSPLTSIEWVNVNTGAIGPNTLDWSDRDRDSYEVTVTDANGCTASSVIEINPAQTLVATPTVTQPVCYQNNGAVSVAVAGGEAPFTYTWSPSVSTSNSASNLAGGTYEITISGANGCEAMLTVTLDDTPGIQITLDGDDVTCNGANDAEIRSTVSGGVGPYTYAWSTGENTPTVNGKGPGTYELTITDANGCIETQSITLAEPDALTATIDVVQPICGEDGGTLTANISGGTAPYNWNWGAVGQPNVQTLLNQPEGNYTLNVTDAGGCTFTATATVIDIPEMTLVTSKTDATCPSENDGSATVVITGGEAPYTIVWSDALAQSTLTATQLTAGSYAVDVTDNRGCMKTAFVTVLNQSTGPIIESVVDSLNCFGGTEAAIDLTITGGVAPYTILWEDGSTQEDRSNLPAGTYEVTVTDNIGCEATQSWTFTNPEEITCTATALSTYLNYFNVSRYGATDGVAEVVTTGGVAPLSYSWTGGSTGAIANNLGGGVASVTVTDANGCTCMADVNMEEPSMVSDFIWEDEDGDGIQDAGETGLAGVQVRLTGRDFNNVQVNFNTTSDANGAYRFDQLPMGNYRMFFTLPGTLDYLYSPANQGGDDALDSDLDPVTLFIAKSITAHGVADFDTDAGFIPRTSVVTIGDKAWYDADHDGIQDPFELEVQGVTVRLYRSVDDLLVNSVVTNEDGEYFFTDVVPGTYYVSVNPATSTIANGFIISPKDVGTNEDVDNDIDPVLMRSDDIVVTATTPDIDFIDIGLHEDCESVNSPGEIAGDEDVCVGSMPGPITSVSVPNNANRYQWYRSTSATYRGPNDPNWNRINGATSASYQPSVLATTVYYIRLATTASCGVDFTGQSNVVVKQAIATPVAEFASLVTSDGTSVSGGNGTGVGQLTMCRSETLTVTADSTSPTVFSWDFGPSATPQTATGRVVSEISFANVDANIIYLSVTNPEGCVGIDSFQINTLDCFGPGDMGGIGARSSGGVNIINWSAISLMAGSYFDIERSIDGNEYEAIESISCIATGAWYDYTYEDKFAPSGKVSYRITHRSPRVDAGPSESVEVTVDQVELFARVYPNPVGSELNLEVASAQHGEIVYQVFSSYGSIMMEGRLAAGRHSLNVEALPVGTYHLRSIAPNGAVEVRTIVKN